MLIVSSRNLLYISVTMRGSIKYTVFVGVMICLYVIAYCNYKDPFYTIYAREDLIRIPLIKPYELLTVAEASPADEFYSWNLSFQFDDAQGRTNKINATYINVSRGVIYGHGKDLPAAPNDWFVIIPDKKIEKIFEDRVSWNACLRENHVLGDSLRKIWPVFYAFRDKGALPWMVNE